MVKKPIMQPPEDAEGLIKFVEELKRQWMGTIDALVDPLMIVEKDFSIAKANMAMAKMAGMRVQDLIGETCYKVFAKREDPCKGCLMSSAAESQKTSHFSLDNIGGDRFFEVTSQPILDSEGQLEGVVQIYRDRTDAKKLQEQLMQSEKLASIGLLAGGFAHEINNPLGGILVFSQMVLREMEEDHKFYEDIKEIELATKRCKDIVESLLDFARQKPAEMTKGEDVTEEVNVVETVESALRFGRVSRSGPPINIEQNWPDEEILVMADRNKLIQLFLNLIKNAFDAMPDGGSLTIDSEIIIKDKVPSVLISIADTGIGISPKYRQKIFDPFFTTKEPGEGTGLGLAICYGIVQDAGGTIELESSPNVGTTFKITLPIVQDEAEKSAS